MSGKKIMKTLSEGMAVMLRLASIMSLLLLAACQQHVSKPQMEVRLKPLSWQSENQRLSHKELAELAAWLNQFPTRDVFLQTSGAQQSQLKQFLLSYGFRTWQLDGINFSEKAASNDGINRIEGVYVQRAPAPCPNYSVANASDSANYRTSGFGCASQRNLMVSVADSRDFIRGKELAPASAEKLLLALQNYYGRASDDNAANGTTDEQETNTSTGVTSNLGGQGN